MSEKVEGKKRKRSKDRKTWFIAVHVGAGYHSESLEPKYEALMHKALKAAGDLLNSSDGLTTCSASEAVAEAIRVMEDSSLTNAGNGSSLTMEGTVECDATIVEGKNGWHGTCASVPGVKNPILLAHALMKESDKNTLSLGRERPIFLTGTGAYEWAKANGLDTALAIDMKEYHVTKESRKTWERYRRRLKKAEQAETSIEEEKKLDTVGAICMDPCGNIASGLSSGGIAMKHPGRVGHAGIPNVGCLAHNTPIQEHGHGIAISCTGRGEDIMRTMLACKCLDSISSNECIDDALSSCFEKARVQNRDLPVEGGILGFKTTLKHSKDGRKKVLDGDQDGEYVVEYFAAHSTMSMGVGCFTSSHEQPQAQILRIPKREHGKGAISCNVSCTTL